MLFATKELEKEVIKNQPKTVIAKIREFNGGRYGRMGEYIAKVKPEYFKNGNVKSTIFTKLETLETIKKGYRCSNAKQSEQIVLIIEIVDEDVKGAEKE